MLIDDLLCLDCCYSLLFIVYRCLLLFSWLLQAHDRFLIGLLASKSLLYNYLNTSQTCPQTCPQTSPNISQTCTQHIPRTSPNQPEISQQTNRCFVTGVVATAEPPAGVELLGFAWLSNLVLLSAPTDTSGEPPKDMSTKFR